MRPGTPTLLITGHGEHDLAVRALRGGAYDFVAKPIDRDYFIASLERAIGMRRLDREVERQRLALAAARERARARRTTASSSSTTTGVIQHWNPAAAAITGLTPSARPRSARGRRPAGLARCLSDHPHRARSRTGSTERQDAPAS